MEVKRLQRYIPPEKIIIPFNEDEARGQRILKSVLTLEADDVKTRALILVSPRERLGGGWYLVVCML